MAFPSGSRPSLTVAPDLLCVPLRTPTLPPATHTNAYLVGRRRAFLVEPATPYPDELARLRGVLQAARARGTEVRALLLTHHHPDHIGGAQALAEALRVPIWAHERTAALVPSVHVARQLEDGEQLPLDDSWLRVFHTPGHAPGHLCFLEERSRALICGDMVASEGTILVDPVDGDMAAYLASLERLEGVGAAQLLPAHGGPIGQAVAKLRQYRRHRLWREARVLACLSTVPRALRGIAQESYSDAPGAPLPLVEASTEAHLIKLQTEGKARGDSNAGWAQVS